MQAAVKAQHDASISQVNFIKEVGFVPAVAASGTTPASPAQLRYVDFNYQKSIPNPDYPATSGSLPLKETTVNLKVPFLTMLTIPAIRIDEVTIDF